MRPPFRRLNAVDDTCCTEPILWASLFGAERVATESLEALIDVLPHGIKTLWVEITQHHSET
jgi:hypothetical protein